MNVISQKNPKWATTRIGYSNATLSRWGCTICSLCMLLGKLQNRFVNPADAAKYWNFNSKGEILWNETEFNGMKFVKRYYSNDGGKIYDYANHEDMGVIVEVNHNHWLYVDKVEGSKYTIFDPWDGKKYDGLPSKYKVTGFALFERSYAEAPEWMVDVWAKAKARGLEEDDPLTEANIDKLEDALIELDVIDKKEGKMTIGRFLVIMDKIKNSW
jgi:hypothetical protein